MPRKIEFKKKAQNRQDCFSAPVDTFLDEFDFEKNLKLFNKKAIFEEIESSNPDLVHLADRKTDKYRPDENVLASKPVQLQQIRVPKEYGVSYTTGITRLSTPFSIKSNKKILCLPLSLLLGFGLFFRRQFFYQLNVLYIVYSFTASFYDS